MKSERLGFGTASLASLDDRKAIWKLLDAALEAGITHFDTARLYGDGIMERTLSPFIGSNRDSITITTKFGLRGRWKGALPARLLPPARRIVKSLVRHDRVRRDTAPATSYEQPVPQLDPETMRSSLDISLRELGVKRIDIFLMHEARAGQTTDELLQALEHERSSGRIGRYGSGGEWPNTMSLASLAWPSPPILQAPTSLALASSEPSHFGAAPDIIHSVFRGAPHIESTIISKGLGGDFPDGFEPGVTVPELFIQWAMMRHPQSRILFGSRSVRTIRANVHAASKPASPELLRKRVEWLANHGLLSSIPI